MKKLIPILIFLAFAGSSAAQDFSTLQIRVHTAPEARRQFLVDSFLTHLTDYPLVEQDTIAYYLFKGTASEVAVAGDANGWDPKASPLQRLSTTDLWFRRELYEADARLDYKLIVDGRWILDPRNPFTVSGGYGPNSELRMPAYVPPQEIIRRNSIPHGTIVDTSFTSTELGNTRTVKIYLPPGYGSGSASHPLVLFHDGMDYLNLAYTATVLDNMIHDGSIPAVIAVFVPPVDRAAEYAGTRIDAFARFVTQEIIPAIDRRYRTIRDPAFRASMGASNGGNIALYLAARYPDVFANAAAQSSNIIGDIFMAFRDGAKLPVRRVYLDVGTYDIPVLIPMAEDFAELLRSRGYDHLYRELHQGHSWGNWRAHIDDALMYLFGDVVSAPSPRPAPSQGLDIRGTAPNPAHGSVAVSYALRSSGRVLPLLHDRAGRLVRSYSPRADAPGERRMLLDLGGIPPGIYYLTLLTAVGAATTAIHIH